MKPALRQATPEPEHSFTVRKDYGIEMFNNWHYHPEVEIIHLQAAGTLLVGEYIGYFQQGDVIFIGSNLPHCFRFEQPFLENGTSYCVKFMGNIMGNSLMNLPETQAIRQLLHAGLHGLRLNGSTRDAAAALMQKMHKETAAKRLISLLQLLDGIAESGEYTQLSPTINLANNDQAGQDKLKKVFEYTLSHYSEVIRLEDMASLTNMSRESFCRYFKGRTRKTYSHFLMEVRIGNACRLLAELDKNVTEISYLCGYNNISHFNHQFKAITNKKPLEYRKDYLQTVKG